MAKCGEMQQFWRAAPPAHGDGVDAKGYRSWPQVRGQRAQGPRQPIEAFGVDEPFGSWMVGTCFDFDCDPLPAAPGQQVDLAVDGAHVARRDAIARRLQRRRSELLAAGA